MRRSRIRTIMRWATGALGVAATAYAAYVASAWARYGHAAPPDLEAVDPLLDRFMPTYDIAERHHIEVGAPAEITLAAARDMDLNQSRIVRAVFKTREVLLGVDPDAAARPRGIVALTTSIGWGVLAEVPLKADAERRGKGEFRPRELAQGARGWNMPSASAAEGPHA